MKHSINISHYYYEKEEGGAYSVRFKFRGYSTLVERISGLISVAFLWTVISGFPYYFKSLFLSEPTPHLPQQIKLLRKRTEPTREKFLCKSSQICHHRCPFLPTCSPFFCHSSFKENDVPFFSGPTPPPSSEDLI